MSINSEIQRIQGAKADLKSAIESSFSVSIPSNELLANYPSYFTLPSGYYATAPTANGIYIKYSDHTYTDYNILWSGKTPMGVAVRTSSCRFVLHPRVLFRSLVTTKIDAPLTKYTSSSSAQSDFNGKSNTAALYNSGYAGGAITYAMSGPFSDGSNGWIPSCGEVQAIRANFANINSAMTLCGGFIVEDPESPGVSFSNRNSHCNYYTSTYYGYWSYGGTYMYWIWYNPDQGYYQYGANENNENLPYFLVTDF